MMMKISVSFFLLVAPEVLAQYGHGGYEYRAPQGFTQQGNPAGFQDSLNRFVHSPTYPRQDYYQSQPGPTQQQPQHNYQTAEAQEANLNRYSQNFATNLLSQPAQSGHATNPGYIAHAPQPVITKHIYFHLPPPDDAATAAPVTTAPPKKIYNIIFIKLPSQKSANAARLQQLIYQQSAVDKTLIYVLVKKPETQFVQPSNNQVTSKPEVFFVKYKEPRSLALQVARPALSPAQLAPDAGLLPGLVNGHRN